MKGVDIRAAQPADLEQVYSLIEELASFEKEPDEPSNPFERFADDFQTLYDCLVAVIDGDVVGISLYYWGYSTWKGKLLYLDDLVVRNRYRRTGIGAALFNKTVELAQRKGAGQMRWQVLDWNKPAIELYQKVKADFYDDWLTCKLEKDGLQNYQPI